jgi:hypothetical protein
MRVSVDRPGCHAARGTRGAGVATAAATVAPSGGTVKARCISTGIGRTG